MRAKYETFVSFRGEFVYQLLGCVVHSCAAVREGTRVDVSNLVPKICFIHLSGSSKVLAASILLV